MEIFILLFFGLWSSQGGAATTTTTAATPADSWDNIELDMAVGSSQSGAADLGYSYDFTVSLVLPEISVASPLSIEIFSADPENGTSSMHICSPTVNKKENVSIM